jgi:hypothetical protein
VLQEFVGLQQKRYMCPQRPWRRERDTEKALEEIMAEDFLNLV